MDGKEDGIRMIIGGDFNVRTGREGRRISWEGMGGREGIREIEKLTGKGGG